MFYVYLLYLCRCKHILYKVNLILCQLFSNHKGGYDTKLVTYGGLRVYFNYGGNAVEIKQVCFGGPTGCINIFEHSFDPSSTSKHKRCFKWPHPYRVLIPGLDMTFKFHKIKSKFFPAASVEVQWNTFFRFRQVSALDRLRLWDFK